MDNVILDVLRPFEEECLFSWVVRMLQRYSATGKIDSHYISNMRTFFGKSVSFPGLYLQHGLDYFVKNSSLNNPGIFSSEESMLDKMTVLPFYKAFLCQNEEISSVDSLVKEDSYVITEQNINLQCGFHSLEGKPHIKLCPKCFSQHRYIKREHLIPGNYVCAEHKVELKYFEYKKRAADLNFLSDMPTVHSYDLDPEETRKAIVISDMVHEIMQNGLLQNLHTIKQKIRSRMRSLGYLNERYNFLDLSTFLRDFGNDRYFGYVDRSWEVFAMVYDTDRGVNPIFYLLLIEFLFGSLESLYEYKPEHIQAYVKRNYYNREWDSSVIFSFDHYKSIAKPQFWKNHTLAGDTTDSIVLFHKDCGNYYLVKKTHTYLHDCVYCAGKEIVEKKRSTQDASSEGFSNDRYVHYLNLVEYAQLHGKERQQIRNYCVSGRIAGAIRNGKNWLIPEDAPYPKDMRRR